MNGNTVKICTSIAAGIGAIGAIFGAYKLGENHGHDKGYIKGYNIGHSRVNNDVLREAEDMKLTALYGAIDYVIEERLADELEARKQAEQN